MPNPCAGLPSLNHWLHCWLLCSALLPTLPSALTPSHRGGSRWPGRAGGWQPLSLHLTCPGLLSGVLLHEAAAPEGWQPCRHSADSVLSLWSTSGLHYRSLPHCARNLFAEWVLQHMAFTLCAIHLPCSSSQ